MNSKVATLFIAISCSALVVASAVAQTFGTSNAQASSPDYARQRANPTYTGPGGGGYIQSAPTGGQPLSNSFRSYSAAQSSDFMPHSWSRSAAEAELDRAVSEAIGRLTEAKADSDRDKIKTQLSELLEKQFDQRQKRHESEIAALEAKVKALKELVAKRQENRRDSIARRLDQILRDAQGLGW
jgi:hypothetical protein